MIFVEVKLMFQIAWAFETYLGTNPMMLSLTASKPMSIGVQHIAEPKNVRYVSLLDLYLLGLSVELNLEILGLKSSQTYIIWAWHSKYPRYVRFIILPLTLLDMILIKI